MLTASADPCALVELGDATRAAKAMPARLVSDLGSGLTSYGQVADTILIAVIFM
jgi:hypothetical protein